MGTVLKKGITGPQRDELLARSKEKVRFYDEFMTVLDDDGDKEEADLGRNIESLKQNIAKLESGG